GSRHGRQLLPGRGPLHSAKRDALRIHHGRHAGGEDRRLCKACDGGHSLGLTPAPGARSIVSDVCTFVWGHAGVDRAAQGLLGAGRRLAESLKGKLRVAVLGGADDSVVRAIQKVADTVLVVQDELLGEYHPESCLAALVAVCKRLSPRAVLLGN